jgi:hypothetical protein
MPSTASLKIQFGCPRWATGLSSIAPCSSLYPSTPADLSSKSCARSHVRDRPSEHVPNPTEGAARSQSEGAHRSDMNFGGGSGLVNGHTAAPAPTTAAATVRTPAAAFQSILIMNPGERPRAASRSPGSPGVATSFEGPLFTQEQYPLVVRLSTREQYTATRERQRINYVRAAIAKKLLLKTKRPASAIRSGLAMQHSRNICCDSKGYAILSKQPWRLQPGRMSFLVPRRILPSNLSKSKTSVIERVTSNHS